MSSPNGYSGKEPGPRMKKWSNYKKPRTKARKEHDRTIACKCVYSIDMLEQRGVYKALVITPQSCLMIKIIHTSLNEYLAILRIKP